MKIKILGTRGEIFIAHPRHLKHSGILIDKKILLDIGEKKFLKYCPQYIFITDLHPDHAFFMGGGEKMKPGIPVYVPEQSERLSEAKVVSTSVDIGGYRITSIPVVHSTKVKSVAYLVEKGDKRIFYKGDIAIIKEHRIQ